MDVAGNVRARNIKIELQNTFTVYIYNT